MGAQYSRSRARARSRRRELRAARGPSEMQVAGHLLVLVAGPASCVVGTVAHLVGATSLLSLTAVLSLAVLVVAAINAYLGPTAPPGRLTPWGEWRRQLPTWCTVVTSALAVPGWLVLELVHHRPTTAPLQAVLVVAVLSLLLARTFDATRTSGPARPVAPPPPWWG